VDDDGSIVFDIFRPKEDLPKPGLGDVMLIRQAKVSYLKTYQNAYIDSHKRFNHLGLVARLS